MSKTIIVTGATGKQGGSVVQALRDSDFEILAVTRNANSPAAIKLANLSANIKPLQGDLADASAIFERAKMLTSNPIWGVYSVQAKPVGDPTVEATQGKNLIDAAIAAGVQFFVYSSVDRGGAKSSSDPTPVVHWANKHRIEKYLEDKAAGTQMRYTVLRPTGFMENISNDFAGKATATSWQLALKDKPMQLIATKDIGWFAANAFKHPEDNAGRYLSLAGASLTFDEANAIFKKRIGTDMPTTFGVVASLGMCLVKEVGAIFKWLKQNGNGADVDECRRMNPSLTDFGAWLESDSAFRKE
ncbi:NAD(P)-binding protein [Lentithecium fluviatile CBS 122367]|uniref:NAD(P)-binding protein n=1 Tax=Lentithecium fluviatile CBS 122367 TaxID=1168545 RepID=A0A6G1J1J3_9PLEO|nr:NAD(P)-binding protein [Lentithecium fluviatile CBS 122367]